MTDRPLFTTARFYAITFLVTWFFWIGLYQTGVLGEQAARIAGTWAPTLAALALIAIERGRSGLADVLGRLIRWRVHPGWYLFALGVTAAIVVVAIGIHRAAGGTVVGANDPAQWYLVFPGLAYIFFVSVLGEEVGWRGYALPLWLSVAIACAGAAVIAVGWARNGDRPVMV